MNARNLGPPAEFEWAAASPAHSGHDPITLGEPGPVLWGFTTLSEVVWFLGSTDLAGGRARSPQLTSEVS